MLRGFQVNDWQVATGNWQLATAISKTISVYPVEFDGFRNQAGLNSFTMTAGKGPGSVLLCEVATSLRSTSELTTAVTFPCFVNGVAIGDGNSNDTATINGMGIEHPLVPHQSRTNLVGAGCGMVLPFGRLRVGGPTRF